MGCVGLIVMSHSDRPFTVTHRAGGVELEGATFGPTKTGHLSGDRILEDSHMSFTELEMMRNEVRK
jgi:hypothetical protein